MRMPQLHLPHLQPPHLGRPGRQDIAAAALIALFVAVTIALIALGIANPTYLATDAYPAMIP